LALKEEPTLQDRQTESGTGQHYDKGYRNVFSNKNSFMHFLTKYIKASWVESITEEDLEHVNATFVTKDFQKRESDVVYKLKNENIFFYVLLELQSEPDFSMPFRLLYYMVNLLAYEFKNTPEEIRELKGFRLPAIVPIVLYNGEGNWTPVRSFKEYTANYGEFGDNIIDFKYLLFDLNRYDENDFLTTRKLLDFIFKMDANHSSHTRNDFYDNFRKITKSLRELTEDDFNTFISWVINVAYRGNAPEDIINEAITAFQKGDEEGMSYAIGRMMDRERLVSKKEGKTELIKMMLEGGKSVEEIIEFTKLSREEIEELIA
jgi:predicted transposase/invertase (TIGR01784 family)